MNKLTGLIKFIEMPYGAAAKAFFLFSVILLTALCGCFGNQDDGALQSQLNYDPLNSGVIKTGAGTLGGFVVTDANNRFGAPQAALASVAKVKVKLIETGLFTYTDKTGYYEFLGIAPGAYTVAAESTDSEGIAYINYSPAVVYSDAKTLASQTIVLKKSCRVFGRVAPSGGADASGFLVSVSGFSPAAAVTSEGGYFRLEALPAEQEVFLIVSKDGYQSKKYGPLSISENKVYSLNEDITVSPLSFAAAYIDGKITDASDGASLSDSYIRLFEYSGGVKTLYKTVYCDISGNFSISAAADANYTIEFSKADYFNLSQPVKTGAAGTRIISIYKMSRAKSDISAYYIITGKVVDGSGIPAAGVKIYTAPFSAQTLTDAAGAYKINAAEGVYDIYAVKPGYLDSLARVTLRPYTVKTAEVDLTLIKNNDSGLYQLTGTVSDIKDAALGGAKVSIDKNKLYTYTNQSGAYSFYIQSGTYEIYASDNKGLEKRVDYYMGKGPQRLDIKIIKN
jgi:hypothetical protein